MQIADEKKKEKILAAAAALFAEQPFHKVLLSSVAEAAGVGKGTLYIYFKSKEALYLEVLYSGFARLVEELREKADITGREPKENLEIIVNGIVSFAYNNPHVFELMRLVAGRVTIDKSRWHDKRKELHALIESVILRGIELGCFSDPHPELTSRFISGLARSALLGGTTSVDRRVLADHILRFTLKAVEAD